MKSQRSFQHELPPSLELVEDSVKGVLPLSFFNPTHALLRRIRNIKDSNDINARTDTDTSSQTLNRDEQPDEYLVWSSRTHAKSHAHPLSKKYNRPECSSLSWFRKLIRMGEIQYWNISWWIAIVCPLLNSQ